MVKKTLLQTFLYMTSSWVVSRGRKEVFSNQLKEKQIFHYNSWLPKNNADCSYTFKATTSLNVKAEFLQFENCHDICRVLSDLPWCYLCQGWGNKLKKGWGMGKRLARAAKPEENVTGVWRNAFIDLQVLKKDLVVKNINCSFHENDL